MTIHVLIEKDARPLGLLFKADGTFQKELPPPEHGPGMQQGQGMGAPPQLTDVDMATLPAAITEYITKAYTGASIKKAGKDANNNYSILIEKDGKPLGLLFDSAGAFQKELPASPQRGKK